MSTFVAEINKLKNIQQNLEKGECIFVEQFSKLDDGSQICELYRDNTKSRLLHSENLQNDIKNIIVPLRKVNNLMTEDNIGNIDLKQVKKEMTAIQSNIHNLKISTKSTLDVLEEEEERFFDEMQAFEQKINEWSKPVASLQKKSAKRISTAISENISQEVKDFMEYVAANGGHENGWTSDDHNLFLKYRAKTKDVNKLAETLHAILPDIKEEEIIAHENWYQKYIELKEKQKTAIKNWRSSKFQTKRNSPPKTNASPQQNSLFKSFSECLSKEELQQKITAWKAEKLRQSRTQKDRELQERLRQKQHEKQQKQKYKQVKAQVESWKTTKKVAEEAEKLEKQAQRLREQKNRASKANKLIKQFQYQDEVFIQNKIQQSRLIRPKSAEQVKVSHMEAPRDPGRLLKPTKQWIFRTFGTDDSGNAKTNLHLQAIPKLGIPEWRKTIN